MLRSNTPYKDPTAQFTLKVQVGNIVIQKIGAENSAKYELGLNS